MKITLSSAKYILQMTERVLQLQSGWWVMGRGHRLGGLGLISSGPLLHEIDMIFILPFLERLLTIL